MCICHPRFFSSIPPLSSSTHISFHWVALSWSFGSSLIAWVPSPSTHFYFTQDKWAHSTFQFYPILRANTAPPNERGPASSPEYPLQALTSTVPHTRQVGPLDLSVLPPPKEQDSHTHTHERGPASSPEYHLQALTSTSTQDTWPFSSTPS